MNKEIIHKFKQLDDALAVALNQLYELKKAIEEDGKEKMWFDNGKIIVNGVEYPIQNFSIEWKSKQLEY